MFVSHPSPVPAECVFRYYQEMVVPIVASWDYTQAAPKHTNSSQDSNLNEENGSKQSSDFNTSNLDHVAGYQTPIYSRVDASLSQDTPLSRAPRYCHVRRLFFALCLSLKPNVCLDTVRNSAMHLWRSIRRLIGCGASCQIENVFTPPLVQSPLAASLHLLK